MVQQWGPITVQALQNAWQSFINFLPQLLGGIIIFIIGWIIAKAVGKLVETLLNQIKINEYLKRIGWQESFEKAGIKLNASGFFREFTKWCLIIIFLMISCDVVNLNQLANFLAKVVGYIPNLLFAGLIFIGAVIASDFTYRIVLATSDKTKISYSGLVGTFVRWLIWIVAILIILIQLKITPTLVNAFIFGIIGMFSLGFGLAFGLGAKDIIKDILEELKGKLSRK